MSRKTLKKNGEHCDRADQQQADITRSSHFDLPTPRRAVMLSTRKTMQIPLLGIAYRYTICK